MDTHGDTLSAETPEVSMNLDWMSTKEVVSNFFLDVDQNLATDKYIQDSQARSKFRRAYRDSLFEPYMQIHDLGHNGRGHQAFGDSFQLSLAGNRSGNVINTTLGEFVGKFATQVKGYVEGPNYMSINPENNAMDMTELPEILRLFAEATKDIPVQLGIHESQGYTSITSISQPN
jgi:hypothetical protein